VGLKIDLIATLLETSRFVFIDTTSISVRSPLPPHISRQEILDHIDFQPIGNPVFNDMHDLIYSTLRFAALVVMIFLILLYTMIRYIISKPISELSTYVDNLKLGKQDRHKLKALPIFELDNLRKSLDVYQSELESAYKSLDIKNDELWQLAHHDPLTGIANRRAFDKDWKSHLAIASDRRINISLMLIDCDHFKAINDTYGHDVGDLLIRQLSKLLQASIREGDRLYRTGGDEFVTILWETDRDTAEKIANRCLKSIRNQRFDELGIKEPISISIGISHKSDDMVNSLEELPRQADIAMYHAKRTGNRNIVHYELSLEKEIAPLVSNHILDAVIKAAESGSGIVMYYQPIIDAASNRVDYYEALVRIEDESGVITPGEIFSVVERLSLEAELDIAIIRQVTDDIAHNRLPEGTGVSINLSSTSLIMPDLAEHLKPLSRFIERQQCILEVTETTLITNINSASLKLSELRQQGFKVALDDFGSGYSSIRYLASMPIDIVKFDISMIRQLAKEGTESVISGTAQVILNSGYKLVAEGIEDEAVKQLVVAMGATHLQGYLLGRPLPCKQIIDASVR
jgi:diguanylate cyclase (GGDEF)-like protein